MIRLLPILLLTGCAGLPDSMPAGSAQVRLSEVSGSVEGVVAGATGTACILTVIGPIPAVDALMQRGSCVVEFYGRN